jgi:rare lipoprotein A
VTLFSNISLGQDNNELTNGKNMSVSSYQQPENTLEVFRINCDLASSQLLSYLDSGITYRYGGTSNKTMDCSAFVGKVFREIFQIHLPRTSREMALLGEVPDTLKAFDLVFFSKNGKTISHVGIYLYDNVFIHCSSTGGKVMISDLSEYKDKFMYGKRIIAQVGLEFLFTRVLHPIESDVQVNDTSSIKQDVKIVENETVQDEKFKIYQEGVASYYGSGFHGKKTASGERFDRWGFTAAHKYLPFGTKVKVTNTSNQKSVIVTINDRGPYTKGRIIDLSEGAMRKILEKGGLCNVTLEIID